MRRRRRVQGRGQRRGWGPAAGLAAISGLRTALGPALALASRRRVDRRWRRIAFALAAAELAADKLPALPDRTQPQALAGRALSGALVGVLTRPRRTPAAAAALFGAAAATVGAFLGLRVRRALTRLLGGGAIANACAGVVEDACAVAAGRRLARAL